MRLEPERALCNHAIGFSVFVLESTHGQWQSCVHHWVCDCHFGPRSPQNPNLLTVWLSPMQFEFSEEKKRKSKKHGVFGGHLVSFVLSKQRSSVLEFSQRCCASPAVGHISPYILQQPAVPVGRQRGAMSAGPALRCLRRPFCLPQAIFQQFLGPSRSGQLSQGQPCDRSFSFAASNAGVSVCVSLRTRTSWLYSGSRLPHKVHSVAELGQQAPVWLAGAERQLRVRHILVRPDQEDLLRDIEAQLKGALPLTLVGLPLHCSVAQWFSSLLG